MQQTVQLIGLKVCYLAAEASPKHLPLKSTVQTSWRKLVIYRSRSSFMKHAALCMCTIGSHAAHNRQVALTCSPKEVHLLSALLGRSILLKWKSRWWTCLSMRCPRWCIVSCPVDLPGCRGVQSQIFRYRSHKTSQSWLEPCELLLSVSYSNTCLWPYLRRQKLIVHRWPLRVVV